MYLFLYIKKIKEQNIIRRKNMTQKELSYVEDAIGHEDNLIKICEETITYLEDDSLVSFMNKELKNHTQVREELMELLEEKANE